jgi:hypothetical protein
VKRVQAKRHPEGARVQEDELPRHDADHGVMDLAQPDASPDGGEIAIEILLPRTVGDHHDGGCARALVVQGKRSAMERRDPRDAECGRGELRYCDELDPPVREDEVALRRPGCTEVLDRRELFAPPREVVQRRSVRATRGSIPVPDRDDPLGLDVWQVAVQHPPHDLGSRCACPDPERDREPADDRQPRVLDQHPEAEDEVE